MKRKFLIYLAFYFLLFTFCFFFTTSVSAQTALDTTTTYEISDPQAKDGEILELKDKKFVRASVPYSNKIYGVLVDNPLIVYRGFEENKRAIATSGVARVLVTTINGPVLPGDFITSSAIPGKGQKATRSGHVLGIALDGFSGAGTGSIQVSLRVGYAELPQGSVISYVNLYTTSFLENIKDPRRFIQVTEFLIALLIVIASLTFSFFVFTRSAVNGIKAIGRNPLAKRAILFSVALNIILAVVVSLGGIVLGFIIITFSGG
ncbi:hypothetical protein HYW46_01285 [Candidatus Daviesbacteria bacterium]|nr:hypothetical protein [Candidatus Daviesbacteria bacterium]